MSRAITKLLQTQGKARVGDLASVDLHTHVYLPRYMALLRSRTDVPFVRSLPRSDRVEDADKLEERLVILPDEQKQLAAAAQDALKDAGRSPDAAPSISAGRPIGGEYWDVTHKLAYMDRHGIRVSVLSLANPWLDFLPPAEQVEMAALLNDDMEGVCASSGGRLLGFGVVPQQVDAAVAEMERLAARTPHVRGLILSTAGLGGQGLDDPGMLPFYEAAERLGLVVFLHPHYGVGNEHYQAYGHALFLALGFTFESTVAVSQLVLSGLLDRVPKLKLLLAHAGGTLPFLAGRLDSCVAHDLAISRRLQHAPSVYLKRFYYDAIAYHAPALQCLLDFVGPDQVVFGTDNPFFPPDVPDAAGDADAALRAADWPSTLSNYEAMADMDARVQSAILRENAEKLLGL